MTINVLQYLEDSALRTPAAPALGDEHHQLSYQALLDLSQRTGTRLAGLGGHNRAVAVFIDRDVESLVMFMGAVYSGNFYVPIDVSMPKQRLELMLQTLTPVACIGKQASAPLCPPSIPFFSYEALIQTTPDLTLLSHIRARSIDTDPVYAIFTSGSTGVPKAVLVSHRSVIDLTEQFSRTFGFHSGHCFGNQAPFDFDVSVKDIYQALKQGARLEVIPKKLFSFPGALVEYLMERQVSVIIWATSALRIVASLKALDKQQPPLEVVMFSGEVMPNKVLNYWRSRISAQYVNLYGPTEITCNCTYFVVDRPFDDDEPLPIGSAFANTEVFLLDGQNRLIPPNTPSEVGEICVRGTCLALGYYNNPEKTAQAFCQNPLVTAYPQRMYRTGDLGSYNERGELMFRSRKDFQIKHMGHRIELGEIETAVNAMPGLDAACCLYDQQREKIVLFYQSEHPCHREILRFLSERLPKYMWPNRLVHFTHLPHNAHGKIDRVALGAAHIHGA